MTALIRGFDESIRDLFRALGPNTVYVTKMSAVSFSSGKTFQELMMRPNVTSADAAAIERSAASVAVVDMQLGGGGPGGQMVRLFYKNQRTPPIAILASTENWPAAVQIPIESGRFFTSGEVERRSRVAVLGQGPAEALFPNADPIGKSVRIGLEAYEVIGVAAKRPSPGGFNVGADDFAIMPVTTYAKQYGIRLNDESRGSSRGGMVVIPLEWAGIVSGDIVSGHRFLGGEPFKVKDFADFEAKLLTHKVVLDPAKRVASIAEQARALAKDAKLELVEDEALLNENAGLTEWPVVLMGSFEKEFLSVPAECLMTSMKAHQKCFSLRDPKTKKLANKFLLVSNLTAKDAGLQVISGNEKVIRARLSDAKFFWDQDL